MTTESLVELTKRLQDKACEKGRGGQDFFLLGEDGVVYKITDVVDDEGARVWFAKIEEVDW